MASTPTPTAAVFDPTVPLHHQVYLQLRNEIDDGLWVDRKGFPGERELAERLGTSVITARTALDRLASEGWIERARGRRPRVVRQPAQTRPLTGPAIVPVGRTRPFAYEVLSADTRIAPIDACRAHALPPGSGLWQCLRLRRHAATPHSVAHNAQLPAIGERHRHDDLARRPMVQLLAKQGFTIASMRRHFGIAHAPTTVAEALGVTIADRLLVSTFTLHDPSGAVLQWVRIYLHPDFNTPEETMDLANNTWTTAQRM